MTDRQVKILPIDSLIPYPKNARTHTDTQIKQIAASLTEFGWTNPVLIDAKLGIIAGHARVEAAKSLGLTECPTIELSGLTEAQARAYILADNKLALNAGWDEGLLGAELDALKGMGFDLELTGFSADELVRICGASEGLTDPDEAPEPPKDPTTVSGDLWLLGKHRLICGDSTNPQHVERVMGGVSPGLMVTDPPYGVEYDPNWRNHARRSGTMGALGASVTGKVANDDRVDWRDVWTLFPGDVAYVWHGGLHAAVVQESLVASDFEIRGQIIWAKQHAVISRGAYHWQHEPCWYAVRKGSTASWAGDRKQTTLWQIANANAFGGANKDGQTGHGTQKPVECMRRPILNHTNPGQCVYEPFSGSGTTIIACESTGRICMAIEIEPTYVDVAVERWQNFTGKHATLEGDGRTFAEIKEGRGGMVPMVPPENIQASL